MPVDQRFATAADATRLAVTVAGSGPPLLMIPGLGSSRRVYDPIVPLLAERCRVMVYDQRGIGDSGVTEGPYTMGRLAADAVAVLDSEGVERAAVWGASMGGMVAQHVALDHGHRVSALILACTGCGGAHAVRADAEVTRALLGKGARTPAEAYRMACTVMYTPSFQASHPDFVAAQIAERARRPVRGRVFSWQYEAVRHHDTYDRLPSIGLPTLVLHGGADVVMPVGNGEILAARVPGARLRVLEGLGHLFFHEDPGAAAGEVLGFLDQTAAGSRTGGSE